MLSLLRCKFATLLWLLVREITDSWRSRRAWFLHVHDRHAKSSVPAKASEHVGCDKRGSELGATDSEARSRARAGLFTVSTVNPFESLDKSL